MASSTEPLTDLPLTLRSLAVRAELHPDEPCLSDSTSSLTNAEFHRDVHGLALALSAQGVEKGDVVAVLLPNCREVITTMYATWVLGAALTPINPALTDAEVTYQLTDSSTRVIVGDERADRFAAAGTALGHIDASTVHSNSEPAGSTRAVATRSAPDDPALIVYTSGTTGRPKGCVLSHSNVDAMSSAIIATLRLTSDDCSLLVLPLFHCNGLIVGTVAPLRAGGRVHVGNRFSPDNFWRSIADVRPTYFSAVPTMYALLADRGPTVEDLSTLRFAICGAAPMPVGLIDTVEKTFGIPIVEGYGLSECTVAATINPLDGPRKAGTVGPPMAGIDVAIDSPEGPITTPGYIGEVLISGPTVMSGYLGLPEETERTIRDGWLHTGDVGSLDADGYLTLVDRLKDMIIRGGENIAPSEIEHVIQALPDVLEVAVVGSPDPIYGEVPTAHVVARTGTSISPETVLDHCKQQLAKFKWPATVVVHPSLPKNSVGKISKRDLRTV